MAVADAEYVGDGRPEGTVVGRTVSELVGFHGVTPTARQSTFTSVTLAAPTITAFGFTQAQATGILNALAAIKLALDNKGITG